MGTQIITFKADPEPEVKYKQMLQGGRWGKELLPLLWTFTPQTFIERSVCAYCLMTGQWMTQKQSGPDEHPVHHGPCTQ